MVSVRVIVNVIGYFDKPNTELTRTCEFAAVPRLGELITPYPDREGGWPVEEVQHDLNGMITVRLIDENGEDGSFDPVEMWSKHGFTCPHLSDEPAQTIDDTPH